MLLFNNFHYWYTTVAKEINENHIWTLHSLSSKTNFEENSVFSAHILYLGVMLFDMLRILRKLSLSFSVFWLNMEKKI